MKSLLIIGGLLALVGIATLAFPAFWTRDTIVAAGAALSAGAAAVAGAGAGVLAAGAGEGVTTTSSSSL